MNVHLPDGSAKALEDQASVLDLAQSISSGLARTAVVGEINGQITDLSAILKDGDQVRIITERDREALDILRHSAAHLMAAAILRLFPGTNLTIGPVTEDGFFYDVHLPEGLKLTEENFPEIQAEMKKLAEANEPFVRCVAQNEEDGVFEDYKNFKGAHNPFKEELIEGFKEKGAFSGEAEAPEVSFYRTGEFIDLCSGPHVPRSGMLKHIKLMRVSGSYWRGDPSREQLVRIYGTAFFKKKELEEYLHLLEEAKKRDHRALGEQLDLFHFIDDAPGFPLLHAKGTTVYNLLMDFMREQLKRHRYQEVRTPLILSEKLWHQSGHYDNYLENMFFTRRKAFDEKLPEGVNQDAEEERPMAVKPMNCPGHLLIYRHRLRSHNEFPLRIAEMGLVHRRELSGVRHGLFRVQAFVQDDAHHFITPEQIRDEINLLIDFFFEVYGAFGLKDVALELSTRPEKSIGSDEMWDEAESALKDAMESSGRDYKLNPGDGAFYGPKIDFHIKDALGRTWQCGTIQLDFSMPERFGLEYVATDGSRQRPVMIHRACYGSVERFMGIAIEHFAGIFPVWLAPVQIEVLPISDKFSEYGLEVQKALDEKGIRTEINLKNDRLGYKIREATMRKVPYILIVGEKEKETATVNVRSRDHGDLGSLSLQDFFDRLEPFNIEQLIQSL